MPNRQLITETISSGNFEEPFYVVNVDDIIDKHQNWLRKMPRIKPFYAVKCNNSPIVLELLAALGLSFDCASRSEIDAVLETGTPAKNIIYANPCKSNSYITYAKSVGVDVMTFDNEDELIKVSEIFPSAKLVLRLKVDDSHAKYHLGMKFGADMSSVQRLLELAKELKLDIIGVSFHVGSGCDSADAYRDAISNVRKVFDMGSGMGFEMTLVDIGGGYPGGSDVSQKTLFDSISRVVNQSLEIYFPESTSKHISIIAEPGRYYVESGFTLTTQIISKRRVDYDTTDPHVTMYYYINDGLYGSFSNTTFEAEEVIPIPEIPEKCLRERQVLPSVIWGPTCDSLDCIRKKIFIPEMKVGEWMTFTDMGAYTLALATKFNGFNLPVVKCHVTPDAIENVLSKLPGWRRILTLIDEDVSGASTASSVSAKLREFIHVHS